MLDFCGGAAIECFLRFLDLPLWQQIGLGIFLWLVVFLIVRIFHWITMGINED